VGSSEVLTDFEVGKAIQNVCFVVPRIQHSPDYSFRLALIEDGWLVVEEVSLTELEVT
jgi:hypothetical protein